MTANEVIETGQTMSGGVPEPSTLVMGAMAALVLGAAGVRRWKKDQEAKASVV
jgi:MYXO-CTERM domain-containing protein